MFFFFFLSNVVIIWLFPDNLSNSSAFSFSSLACSYFQFWPCDHLETNPPLVHNSLMLYTPLSWFSGGEGSRCPVRTVEEHPPSWSGAGHAAGVGGGATVLPAAQPQLWGQGPRKSLQGENKQQDPHFTLFIWLFVTANSHVMLSQEHIPNAIFFYFADFVQNSQKWASFWAQQAAHQAERFWLSRLGVFSWRHSSNHDDRTVSLHSGPCYR